MHLGKIFEKMMIQEKGDSTMNNLSRGIATYSYRHVILHFLIALSLVFACPLFAKAECSSSIGDYIAIPPFLSSGVKANLLLMLDNSGSMGDLAYVDEQEYCYDDTYDPANDYAGYFDRDVWYYYDQVAKQFVSKTEAKATTLCSSANYDNNDICITIDESISPKSITIFLAKGNFLNWATASKLDIQKKILTGGKYDPENKRFVMESRGCIGSRFVKQVAVTDSTSSIFYLTLGVRPPEDTEKVGASDNTTRIEIFDVTDTGFNATACQDAIAELQDDSPNQGQIKQDIEDCMGYHSSDQGLADKMNAFNHSIHNCWYYAKSGTWPTGEGSVQTAKNDCEKIYDAGVYPWQITPDDMGYVCFGMYDNDPDAEPNPNPFGYVGRCWTAGANATFECMQWKNPNACKPFEQPDPECCLKWECTGGTVAGWDAAGYGNIDACIEAALQDYCGILKVPEVIDPSDQASETSELWNIPAVLIDSGVTAQVGKPIAVLKGYIEQTEPPTGIIQEFAEDLRIGAMIFNDYGSKTECNDTVVDSHILSHCRDTNRDGGKIISYIDGDNETHTGNLVSAIKDIKATSWTPIAEAMYTAIGYYTQDGTLRLDPDDFWMNNEHPDPVQFWCQHNNILIITEGASTADRNPEVIDFINQQTEDDNDTDVADCGSLDGSTYLDDLTYYAQHIYPENKQPDDKNKQNITTHIVVAGTLRSTETSDECSPDILLQNAALNGGTLLHKAENQSDLERELRKIFMEIREGAAAGSAASVISASRAGEGVIYQAIFFPKDSDLSGNETNWSGEVHALFVDAYGNMREDTNENDALDLDTDRFVVYDEEEIGNAKLYEPVDDSGKLLNKPDETYKVVPDVDIMKLNYIWSTRDWLSNKDDMNATTQRIYTWNDHERYIFTDKIDTTKPVSIDNVDNKNVMHFTPGFVNDAANDNYYFLNPATPEVGLTEDEMITEAQNIIRFVRGEEGLSETGTGTEYRNRTLDKDGDGTDEVYRLGDIIHSTPTVVSQPSEDYDLLYRDDSYRAFRKKYLNRRIVVYAGANDGMLHAFNGGFYDASAHKFDLQPNKWDSVTSSWIPDLSYMDYDLGSELWAYVPNALLPHLKWLKGSLDDNTHVYYVDLKPRIFDARIFSDADHPGGWGTVLIGGMRLGGAPIGVDTNGDGDCVDENDLNFRSTYFALDITNPEEAPSLLWSFSDDNLGFTTSYPTPIRVGSKWFIVIGSGPVDYEAVRGNDGDTFYYGGSNRTPSLYILNAADGTLARKFSMDAAPHSFMAAPIAVDFDLYSGEPYTDSDGNGQWNEGEPYTDVNSNDIYDASGIEQWYGEAIYIASDGCGA